MLSRTDTADSAATSAASVGQAIIVTATLRAAAEHAESRQPSGMAGPPLGSSTDLRPIDFGPLDVRRPSFKGSDRI